MTGVPGVPGMAGHRAVVSDALTSLGLTWSAFPWVLAEDDLSPAVRLSGLLVLLTGTEPDPTAPPDPAVAGATADPRGTWSPRREPWERLARTRLPWTAVTATIAVAAVTRPDSFDAWEVGVALRGAKQVCEAGEGDLALMEALADCRDRLDACADHEEGIDAMRHLVRRVLASATPPDLLDLSLLVDGDAWAAPARRVARELPADEVTALVRLLGELGPRKPSRRWLGQVERTLATPAATALLRGWLELAAHTDVVPQWPDHEVGQCLGVLFVGTNADVVRAAVWATTQLPEQKWPAVVLGTLARRGAAHNGLPGFPEALALKVASAAVDALVERGGPADRTELVELLEDLQRRDLLKKVGAALDRGAEAAARDEELRRSKARAVRRAADPAPRKARAAAHALVRQHLGPELRAMGFRGGPTTWRRVLDDRVDVIGTGVSTDLDGVVRVGLGYGTRFDAAHPTGEPWPLERTRTTEPHLDVRCGERSTESDDPLSARNLSATARRIVEVVVPFLDTLGRYELARAVLEHHAGVPSGAVVLSGNPGSPASCGVLGLLALAAGDRETALANLEVPYAHASERLTEDIDDPDRAGPVAFWSKQLDRARDLP